MDSSNSGSFQSSSGGAAAGTGGDNDEYDSTTQSISSFFNNSTNFNPNLNQILQPPPPPPSSSSYPHHQNHHQLRPTTTNSAFYNPSSTPNFSLLQDPGSAWTGTIQPDQNNPNFSNYPINPAMDGNTKTGRGSDHHQIGVTMKNPKKRTRASRRAPTTVLTTDTTNFRQMVQEFTGIPTAPFTTAPFSRRLDLFRPSVQKIQRQPPPFLNSTANIVDSGTSNRNSNSNNTTTATSPGNFHFTPSNITDFQKQPSTFMDLQNPMFSFQSLLQNSVPQQSNDLSGFQNEKMENQSFEGGIGNTQNIGGSKFNSGGDQVQGNEGSWSCPSN